MQGAAAVPDMLRNRLEGARRVAVVGIGDELHAADHLGMTAAREIERQHLPGVRVFFAGTVPESMTGPLRKFRPDHVLFLDAAEMGERPGTIAVIAPREVEAGLLSTHALPLPVVMDYIGKETGAGVTLAGIQPASSTPGRDLSEEERAHLDQNLRQVLAILRNRNA